jgi:hypothetical protein
MPRRNALQVAIEDAVIDVTDEVRASDHQAPQDARRRDGEAEAAAVLGEPLAPLRERLVEIEAQIGKLRPLHLRQGDACAGRLIATLERERDDLNGRMGPAFSPSAA